MQLANIIADGSMKALAMHMKDRKISSKDLDVDALLTALKTEVKASIRSITDDAPDMLKAGIGDAWIRKYLNVECNGCAVRALDATMAA